MAYGGKFTRTQRYLLLGAIPLYFIAIAFILQRPAAIAWGLKEIVVEPDFLITDYMAVGGIGAAFANAAILMAASIFFCYRLGLTEDGHTIAASCLMFGFSLFGKNIVNIWSIILGVWLYSRYHKTHFSRYVYIALYATSLSPIITQLLYIIHLPALVRIPLSLAVGVIIGFMMPPMATHVHYAHQGYSLYNVGFAAGIVATVIVSVMKSFGYETKSRLIWSTGNNRVMLVILMTLFFGMIVIALGVGGRQAFEKYREILKTSGGGGIDYLKTQGGCPVMLNMGVNGIFSTLFILAIGGDLNGPTIGGIFTVVGFSATGKHIRNIWPIMLGVCLASVTGFWKINSPSACLALLFSTTLAPIAGDFGILPGVLAGFLHACTVMQIGALYDGMNLYNNGFAGGIVAIFLVPVIQSIRDRRARAKGSISL
jgi:hypothetical protein